MRPRRPPGWKRAKSSFFEAASFEQDRGKGVAEDEHDGGAGGRGEVERTGFLGDADVEMDVGVLGEKGFWVAGHGDDPDGEALEGGEKVEPKNVIGVHETHESHKKTKACGGCDIHPTG